MRIKTLRLKNFRNYAEAEISFADGVTVLSGANAQGKTNCAEAIFFLCTGYSPRVTREKQLVRLGEESGYTEGTAESLYGPVKVHIDLFRNDKKAIFINEMPVPRIGELFGNIHSVFFNPGELKLVQESPEDRRRFMNLALSQMSKQYFYALQKYNKILFQRNNLLKSGRSDLRETLSVWDEQLSVYAAKIIARRNELLEKLSPLAEEAHAFISSGKEALKLSAESGYRGGEEEIREAFLKDLHRAAEKDLRLGFTTVGPHRDDMKIFLNGEDVRLYGSQGQQRTVALSLKLAETEIFRDRFGEYPILILDDVLSELDKSRRRKLMAKVGGIQTILTCTSVESAVLKGFEYSKITVKNGVLKGL